MIMPKMSHESHSFERGDRQTQTRSLCGPLRYLVRPPLASFSRDSIHGVAYIGSLALGPNWLSQFGP